MPRMTVYLPADLYKLVKKRRLPVSELLQTAIRREIELEAKRMAADRLIEELDREHGPPSAGDVAWVDGIARRHKARAKRAG